MSKNLKKKIALSCAVCLAVSLTCGFTYAEEISETDEENIEIAEYSEVPVYLDDALFGNGLIIDEFTYVPIVAFCEAMNPNVEVFLDEEAGTETAIMFRIINSKPEDTGRIGIDRLILELNLEEEYITANDRYLYVENGIRVIDDTVMVPARVLCRAFGVEAVWDEENKIINISTEGMSYIENAGDYYDEDDVYWLSRLINSEAGNQPLEGKIGVGNVVLNRVEEPSCPDNIYDVIFDCKYGVQFSVTTTGGIYLEPNEESVIAAMICLEGYNTVGDSIYFFNPAISSSAWFEENFQFTASIGDHDFYA